MNSEQSGTSLTLEALWQFSLQYYMSGEVKEACLALQNHFGGNVNLLLLLKWLDEHHLTFPPQEWECIEFGLERSEPLLQQYRELRRQMKKHLPDSLYRESLQFELQLERQQQSDLVRCINSLPLVDNHGDELTLQYCRQLGAESLFHAFSSSA